MKKTQILSAIALAFALGVVAPIASVSAVDDPTYTQEQNEKNATAAIESAKKSFGTVTLKGENNKVVNGYTEYENAAKAIADANKVVSDAKAGKANATGDTIAKTLKTTVAGLIDDAVLSASTKTLMGDATTGNWAAGDYNQVVEIVGAIRADYTKKVNESEDKDAYTNVVNGIDEALKAAQTSLDGEVANADVSDLTDELKALTGEEVDAPKTVKELNAIIAKVEAALPQMKRFLAVQTAIKKLNDGITAKETTDQINHLISVLNAAVAGTGNGTDTPAGSDVNAPATGIAGTAEGTATTVSIVAGLATALTALGAGVVAYRSARRK